MPTTWLIEKCAVYIANNRNQFKIREISKLESIVVCIDI